MALSEQFSIKRHFFDLTKLKDGSSLAKMMGELQSLLGYDFKLTKLDYEWFVAVSKDERVSKLGQVFTPPYVAQLIADMCITSPNAEVLDPCFGEGIFLKAAVNRLRSLSSNGGFDRISGVELDPVLFMKGLSTFLDSSGYDKEIPRNFFNGSIFDFEKGGFDAIILNPPYVRQEDLAKGPAFLDKKAITAKVPVDAEGERLSGRSNLYSYFIAYLERLLARDGRMGIITSNAWLDSKFGRGLQDFLLKNFMIEYVIDFSKDSFPEVNVEDCIMIIRKKDRTAKEIGPAKFVHVKEQMPLERLERLLLAADRDSDDESMHVVMVSQDVLAKDSKWRKYLYVPGNLLHVIQKKLIPLSYVAKIERGLTTGWNDFFIVDQRRIMEYSLEDHVRPIISSPKDLVSYSTNDARLSKILVINEPLEEDSEAGLKDYVRDFSKKHENLEALVKGRRNWYVIDNLKTSSIIFGYIIRKTKVFALNKDKFPIRDNFYCISPEFCDPLLLFGILNSSLSKALLELSGRRYGRGLLKVQAYELEGLPIPDPRWMPTKIKDAIAAGAKKLADSQINEASNTNIIREIDIALCEYLDNGITPEQLSDVESELSAKRLARVNGTTRDNHDTE